MSQKFIVACRVSGGITGTRQSVCKNDKGVIEFDTREAAQAYADENMKRTQGSPHRTANFQYWVEPSRELTGASMREEKMNDQVADYRGAIHDMLVAQGKIDPNIPR